MSNGVLGLLGLAAFFAPFAAADWALRRWGSVAMRHRHRAAGRALVLFVGVYLVCGSLGFFASHLWRSSPAPALVLALLVVPSAVGVALGLDRAIPARLGVADMDTSS